MRGEIVVGAGYGDEGKGHLVDLRCKYALRTMHWTDVIVCRFSGGQQAGHTVERDGTRHVFSNYGAGTLLNVATYISEHCTIYPVSIMNERKALLEKGAYPLKLKVHPFARVTTPYDVAFNRIKSKSGSTCGMGVGTTMTRHEQDNIKIFAIDLFSPTVFVSKLAGLSQYYYEKLFGQGVAQAEYLSQWNTFNNIAEEQVRLWGEAMSQLTDLIEIKDYNCLRERELVIFEGSQGVMLDMDHGVFPYVTYANTTAKNALEICKKLGCHHVGLWNVTRPYQTRHGDGPMTSTKSFEPLVVDRTNVNNQFQGQFRTMEFDPMQLDYAIAINNAYLEDFKLAGGAQDTSNTIFVTCLDHVPGNILSNVLDKIRDIAAQRGIKIETSEHANSNKQS